MKTYAIAAVAMALIVGAVLIKSRKPEQVPVAGPDLAQPAGQPKPAAPVPPHDDPKGDPKPGDKIPSAPDVPEAPWPLKNDGKKRVYPDGSFVIVVELGNGQFRVDEYDANGVLK